MKPEIKRFEIKQLDDEGHGLARIATLSAIDKDGDTYEKGAFGEQFVMVLPTHNWSSVPLGKARIFEQGDDVLAEFELNLQTGAGREWHAALKFDLNDGRRPLQEWSYGFTVLESTDEVRDGERVRVLKRMKVHEISPVLVGAGVGTGTLSVKNAEAAPDELLAKTAERIEQLAREVGNGQVEDAGKFLAGLTSIVGSMDRLKAAVKTLDAAVKGDDISVSQAGRLAARFEIDRLKRGGFDPSGGD